MNYYINGDAAKADQIKAAFSKFVSIQEMAECDFSQEEYLFYTGQEERGTFVYSTWVDGINANLIKTHPGYQELELPIEPKFKVGDWLYHNTLGARPILVKGYSETHGYEVECIGITYYLQKGVVENEYHLWTIQDAKDGDALVSGIDNPFIYDGNIEFSSAGAYVGISRNGRIRLDMFPSKAWTSIKDVKPATKEQRNLLFAKIREAGYEWDAEKKELCKIQPHYDIANFKPFDKVLVRDDDNECWMPSLFGWVDSGLQDGKFVCGTSDWYQCIPFEGNEHLLGTTDMPSEEYINW